MTPKDWLTLVPTIPAVIAVVVAFLALRLGVSSFKRDHRPILRPVPYWAPEDENDPNSDLYMASWAFVGKNLGRGPAISIQVFDNAEKKIIGSHDALEPLASGETESDRPGRAVIYASSVREKKPEGYTVFYQDVLGEWHATDFWVYTVSFTARFRGLVARREVPAVVRAKAQVLPPSKFRQEWEQFLDDQDRARSQMRPVD